jgi:hypothetical protein
MSAKAMVSGALIVAVYGWAARAAEPPAQPPAQPPAPETLPQPSVAPGTSPLPEILPAPGSVAQPPAKSGLPPGSVPDPWINYVRPGCCGPIGADGPIGYEFYTRNGVSIPVATGLKPFLQTGWMTAVGARSLFFNKATDAAWSVDLGLSYTYNNSGSQNLFTIFEPFSVQSTNPVTGATTTQTKLGALPVTVRDYQRASLNTALGREWYLLNPAYQPGWHLRFGIDSGGRWGASRLEFNELTHFPNIAFHHRYDVFGAYFISLHSDLEVPLNACYTFIAGIRAEWNYDWSDILHDSMPGIRGDLQDVNLLMTFGFRY